MNIPLNGRIAIVDDKIEQAQPLMNVLAQKQCPYSYYSGELKYLPEEGNNSNDVRILFLDINLIDDASHTQKELKAKLVPVLSRIISKENYPYVLIYWSRHEDEYAKLVQEIFDNDLPDRKPIAFLSQNKLSYFKLDSERTDDFEQNVTNLFENISTLINSKLAYSYLVGWENQVHKSTDKTLQEIFSACHSYESWSDNANFLISKLGESYSGRSTYKNQSPEEKIKSSYQSLNNVFIDTLEYSTNNYKLPNAGELSYSDDLINKEVIYSVNKKLLLSDDKEIMEYSGAVTEDINPKTDKAFEDLLNNAFNRKVIEDHVRQKEENSKKEKRELDKIINSESSIKRKEIRASWKKIYCVTTPLCDYVQKKCYNIRVVKGMLIKAVNKEFIDEKSEAIFISPKFKFEDEIYVLVLHFRYFFTAISSQGVKDLSPLFRIRQQLLAEVQSKLARHISRQGVLFVDDI